MSSVAVVINPSSGGGRGRKVWRSLYPGLLVVFDEVIYRISNHVDDIKVMTEELLQAEPDCLVVVGGDGTLSQAINGFIKDDKPRKQKTQFAYYNAGCGGDFARQFDKQHITDFLVRLKNKQGTPCNVGKIIMHDTVSYFINIASVGLSAHVAILTEQSRWVKKLGGTVNYLYHSLAGLLSYKKTKVLVEVDQKPPFECNLLLMAMCNGQYFGGRMHIAPLAKVDDDLLDVVIIENLSRIQAMFKMRKLYKGSHLQDAHLHYLQGKHIKIKALEQNIPGIEADGELVGSVDAEFSLIETKIDIVI